MLTLSRAIVTRGACTLEVIRSQFEGNHAEFLLNVDISNLSDPRLNRNYWVLVVGSSELNSIAQLASKLLAKATESTTKKPRPARDGLIKIDAICESASWKLYIDFLQQKHAGASDDTEQRRWRLYPGSHEQLLELLDCLAQCANVPQHQVATLPGLAAESDWLVPFWDAPPGALSDVESFRAVQRTVGERKSAFASLPSEFQIPTLKVLKHYPQLDGYEIAQCKTCKREFLRQQRWKKECLRCYRSEAPPP